MKHISFKLASLAIAMMFSLAGCGQSSESPDQGKTPDGSSSDGLGRISFHMVDAPVEVDHLWVVIEQVSLKSCAGGGWIDVPTITAPFDLLTLSTGEAFQYISHVAQIPLGTYCETRLIIGEEATIVLNDGDSHSLEVPSGGTSGYKIKGEYEVRDDALAVVTLDFDVEKSLHKAGSSGKYIIRPTIEIESVRYESNKAIPVVLKVPRTLSEVMAGLPPDVSLRGMAVQFEPRRTGTLALTGPTQSIDAVLEQYVQARDELHSRVRSLLMAGGPEFSESALVSAEIQNLNDIEAVPVEGDSVVIISVFADGPTSSVSQYAESVGGTIDE